MDDRLRFFVWKRDNGTCKDCGRKLTETPDYLKKDFLTSFLSQKEIPIYKWTRECWKCGRETSVVSYCFTAAYARHIGDIEKLDRALNENYDFVKKVYSNTQHQEVIANTCIHCGSLQGNWFIRDDLIDLMCEENLEKLVDKKLPNNLTREDLHVGPEEPKPIEFRLRIGHIHHKDLNWENDDPNNLILLCENCHNKQHVLTGKTSASRSRKQALEEARLRREKKQADKWRKNYYAMKNQTRTDSPSELFKKRKARRDHAKHPRY